MPSLISLTIFLMSLLFFTGAYFFSALFYERKHQMKYSLFRMFPYEFNYPSSFKDNVYGNIAFIIAIIGVIGTHVYSLLTSNANRLDVSGIVIIALAVILTGFICCLLFMPLRYLKFHIAISSLAMVFSIGISALICFIAINKLKIVVGNTNQALSIIAIIVSALLGIIMLLFAFNPKATYKIYYEKETDENGNEKLIRPKFIPMAFNEWLTIITFLLSPLGLVILTFIK